MISHGIDVERVRLPVDFYCSVGSSHLLVVSLMGPVMQ